MKPVNLSRKVTAGFVLAWIILVLLGVVSYRSTVQFAATSQTVASSHETITALNELLNDAASAESEARGYLITGDKGFEAGYRAAYSDAMEDLQKARARALDPAVRTGFESLARLVRIRMDLLERIMEMGRSKGLEAARLSLGPGKKLMDEARKLENDIESTEQRRLNEQAQISVALSRRTIRAVLLCGSAAALVTAASLLLVSLDIAYRERLEKKVLEISEREQRRIGQDLHDGVCQQLTGISLFSRGLQQKLSGPLAEDAARITDLINASIEQTRKVTRGLHPVPDEPTGLMLALKELAENVQSTAAVTCKFDCPEPAPIPDQVAATNLYRIAQEAVQNALRHGQPKTIVIELRSDDQAFRLTVRDDGRGFPEKRTSRGLGLEIMEHRAQTMDASVQVNPGDVSGIVVTCTLPRSSLT